jgi:(S)-ureidoglycine aminohydrolase
MSRRGLVWSRSRVERDWALLVPEGLAESVLPEWKLTVARIQAAPAMGARFAQYDLVLSPGGGTQQTLAEGVESFLFVHAGVARVDVNGAGRKLETGGFAYMRPGSRFSVTADGPARLLWLKKRWQPWGAAKPWDLFGNENEVAGETYMELEGTLLKTLLPADPAFDMAMNVFTFPPGGSLPMVETHVMEHGLVFLQGQGLYYLGREWMEVKQGDFIWMGPYVPQSFYAAGPDPSRYIYYKDVHRDVTLP